MTDADKQAWEEFWAAESASAARQEDGIWEDDEITDNFLNRQDEERLDDGQNNELSYETPASRVDGRFSGLHHQTKSEHQRPSIVQTSESLRARACRQEAGAWEDDEIADNFRKRQDEEGLGGGHENELPHETPASHAGELFSGLRHRARMEHQRLQTAQASERLRAAVNRAIDAGPSEPGPRVLLREEVRRAEIEAKALADAIALAYATLGEPSKPIVKETEATSSTGWPTGHTTAGTAATVTPSDCSFASPVRSPDQDSLLYRESKKLIAQEKAVHIACDSDTESLDNSQLKSQVNAWLQQERVKNLVTVVEPHSHLPEKGRRDSLLYREAKAWMELEEAKSHASTDDQKSNAEAILCQASQSSSSDGHRSQKSKHRPHSEARSQASPDDQRSSAESLLREAECRKRQEQAQSRALANIQRLMVSAQSANGLKELCDARCELALAIDAAKRYDVSEADLTEAEGLRRRIHNAIEDLKGSIRVYCCVRPLSKKEIEAADRQAITKIDNMTVQVQNLWEQSNFSFDAVFLPAKQEEVFKECRDLIQSALDGHNVTIFAYGQTGGGKTYTLFGQSGQPGLAPRTIRELFQIIHREGERFSHTVTASMLELYRNDLVDLLDKDSPKDSPRSNTPRRLNIRVDQHGAVQIDNLVEHACRSAEELTGLVERCHKHRTTRATAMNTSSSRSHLIFTIRLARVNLETGEELSGKIKICDLAGSERLKKSNVVGDAAKEAIEINRSLTALGDVVAALRQGQKQVPYRNHKLTQLMQDCLAHHSKVLMFVNCSPASSNLEESLMSLKYATRAKKVRSGSIKRGSTA